MRGQGRVFSMPRRPTDTESAATKEQGCTWHSRGQGRDLLLPQAKGQQELDLAGTGYSHRARGT